MLRKKIQVVFLLVGFILPGYLLAAEKLKTQTPMPPIPPKSAALLVQQSDIQALDDYEKKIVEVREKLQTGKRFTDSVLRYYRRQLGHIYLDLEVRDAKYKGRIMSARSLMKSTATAAEEDKSTSGAEFKVEYDPYYLKKMREFKQEIAFYEGRLLQIRLLEYEVAALVRNITRIRSEVNNSGLWDAATPFYKPASWSIAGTQIVNFTSKLFGQLSNICQKVSAKEQWGRFWSSALICLAVFIIYFYWAIRYLEQVNKKPIQPEDIMRHCSLFVIDVVLRGFLPALFVICVFRYFINWMGIAEYPLTLNFVRSIGNSIGFILATGAVVYGCCRYFHYRSTQLLDRLATPMLILMYQIAVIVFVNNINIFNASAKAYPFYPSQATDLVNLVIAVTLTINLYWLASRVKQIAGVLKNG
ncbi:MAG: hypothetical protein P1U34_05045 [Coxiellaceae bacterium]|nr:hypothetical protein [Coxiellaceae bacterium]